MLNQVNRSISSSVDGKTGNQSGISIFITLLIWVAVSWLTLGNTFKNANYWLSDVSATYLEKSYVNAGVVIVAIDTPSFQNIGSAWPWPRSKYADLLDAVSQAGAKATIFDIVFDQSTADDGVFAEAIQRFGAVILASEHSVLSTPQGSIETLALPTPILLDAASGVGKASLPLDKDGRIRRLPVSEDASDHTLMSASVQIVQPDSFVSSEVERYIRYSSGEDAIPVVSFYQALNPQEMLPEGFLKDKTVIVGLSLAANPDVQSFVGDEVLVPPYGATAIGKNNGWVPGVYVQALALNTSLGKQALIRAPLGLELLLGMVGFVSSLVAAKWAQKHLKRAMLIVCLIVIFLMILVFVLRANSVVLMVMPALIATSIAGIFQTSYAGLKAYLDRRKLVAGFGKYVAPQILKELIDSEEPPKLGGEMREISVIVTDLEGYTALMESLSAEEGAQLLREYLALVGKTVLDHGGMIDQFIGDSVVAIFNAPTDQPDHVDRALKCIKALEKYCLEFHQAKVAQGLLMGNTRIGAHCGVANVGNFGSEDRFHYTAIGDVVNVASRLEAANKTIGTLVLVSKQLIEASSNEEQFLPIGEVSVYGKSQSLEVFTSAEDLTSSDFVLFGEAYKALSSGDAASISVFKRLQQKNTNNRAVEYLSQVLSDGRVAAPKVKVGK